MKHTKSYYMRKIYDRLYYIRKIFTKQSAVSREHIINSRNAALSFTHRHTLTRTQTHMFMFSDCLGFDWYHSADLDHIEMSVNNNQRLQKLTRTRARACACVCVLGLRKLSKNNLLLKKFYLLANWPHGPR